MITVPKYLQLSCCLAVAAVIVPHAHADTYACEFQLTGEWELKEDDVPYRASSYDANGDGIEDLVYSGGFEPNTIRVYTLPSGQMLWEYSDLEETTNVKGFYDMNGDGLREAVLESYDISTHETRERIIDWQSGEVEFLLQVAQPDGVSIRQIRDVDGDSLPELVMASIIGGEWRNEVWGYTGAAEISSGENLSPFLQRLICRPIPASGGSTISFVLTVPIDINATIYDVQGRCVRSFRFSGLQPGGHEIRWDGLTDSGVPAPSGSYFFRLGDGPAAAVSRIDLVR